MKSGLLRKTFYAYIFISLTIPLFISDFSKWFGFQEWNGFKWAIPFLLIGGFFFIERSDLKISNRVFLYLYLFVIIFLSPVFLFADAPVLLLESMKNIIRIVGRDTLSSIIIFKLLKLSAFAPKFFPLLFKFFSGILGIILIRFICKKNKILAFVFLNPAFLFFFNLHMDTRPLMLFFLLLSLLVLFDNMEEKNNKKLISGYILWYIALFSHIEAILYFPIIMFAAFNILNKRRFIYFIVISLFSFVIYSYFTKVNIIQSIFQGVFSFFSQSHSKALVSHDFNEFDFSFTRIFNLFQMLFFSGGILFIYPLIVLFEKNIKKRFFLMLLFVIYPIIFLYDYSNRFDFNQVYSLILPLFIFGGLIIYSLDEKRIKNAWIYNNIISSLMILLLFAGFGNMIPTFSKIMLPNKQCKSFDSMIYKENISRMMVLKRLGVPFYKDFKFDGKFDYDDGLDIIIPSVRDNSIYQKEISARIKYIDMLKEFPSEKVKKVFLDVLKDNNTPNIIRKKAEEVLALPEYKKLMVNGE